MRFAIEAASVLIALAPTLEFVELTGATGPDGGITLDTGGGGNIERGS